MPGIHLPVDFDTGLNSANCWDEEDEEMEVQRLASLPKPLPVIVKVFADHITIRSLHSAAVTF